MGQEDEEDNQRQNSPFLCSSSSSSDTQEQTFQRTGTIWTALAHIITGVIGAGVLSLAWSTAQLGWIAGPLLMLVFAGITLLSTSFLCDFYKYPDPIYGPLRVKSFSQAVKLHLGGRSQKVCQIIVHGGLWGTGVAYTIASATSIRAIQESNCYHKQGHKAACVYEDSLYIVMFGVIQIAMSQIPDFHKMDWLSIIAAFMSFIYSFIGLGLGIAQVIVNGKIKGSLTGNPAANAADKLWLAFQALGDIAFAYPYSVIVLEIQDTLKASPPENKTMKKASMVAIFVTTFFYICCGGFGYAAFGEETPGNLLTGFGFYEPYWLIDLANACIVLHLVGGYQVYSQPVFSFVEKYLTKKFPGNRFVNKVYCVQLPFSRSFQLDMLKLWVRSSYVVLTTVFSLVFPYFNQVLGLIGAVVFWPLTIYFPVEMYIVQKRIVPWTNKWIFLRIFSFVCLLATVLALIGSIEGLIRAKFE